MYINTLDWDQLVIMQLIIHFSYFCLQKIRSNIS